MSQNKTTLEVSIRNKHTVEFRASLVTDGSINTTVTGVTVSVFDSTGTVALFSETDVAPISGVGVMNGNTNVLESDELYVFKTAIDDASGTTHEALFFGHGNNSGYLDQVADGRHGRIIKYRLGY